MARRTIRSDSIRSALRFLGESGGKPVTLRETTAPARRGLKLESGGHEGMPILSPPALGADAIPRLAGKLDVAEDVILGVSGLSLRTYKRRQATGYPLTDDEADRIFRIARVASEAERVFGDLGKATRWLSKNNAVLGAPPLSMLATDAGTHEVEAELTRIDWGEFA